MRRLHRSLILFLLVCAGASLAVAADASFTASVESTQVAVGESFEIRFTLDGSTGGRNFRPPGFNDFEVLSGPSQSTSMQIVNGSMSSSIAYGYVLQPRSEGKFTIGSASIEVDGTTLRTQPVTMTVVKGSGGVAQKPGASGVQDVSGQVAGNVLLRAIPDRTRVFQGEQITVTYKLYTRLQILGYNQTRSPSLTGFWSEDLETPKEVRLSTEMLDGRQYAVGVLRKVALFPQHGGDLELDPMEVQVTVPVRRRTGDVFDQFFNSEQPVNYRTASDPIKITVLPLPSENVPPGFQGAVGKFEMDARLDKQEVKTNDPVTLRIRINGRGNLKLLQAPELSTPPDLERFDPKINTSVSPEGGTIAGSRTFEYLMIPRHAGDQVIPPFSFSYFDPDQKKYVSLKSPELVVKVARGSETEVASAPGVSREDVKLVGEDIRFIKSGSVGFRRKGEMFAGSPLFYGLIASPPFVFALLLVALKRREKTLGDVFALRSRNARKMAKRRLSVAAKLLKEKKQEAYYAEVSRALWGYLSDRFGIPAAELSRERVQAVLQGRGVSQETVSGFAAVMDRCEFARFAPAADSMQMEQVLEDAVRLVSTIEGQLR